MTCDYYLTKTLTDLYELRQTRFKEQYEMGLEHPHDVCAFARSKEEMRRLVELYKLGSVEWESVP